jgi:hypothetical protein
VTSDTYPLTSTSSDFGIEDFYREAWLLTCVAVRYGNVAGTENAAATVAPAIVDRQVQPVLDIWMACPSLYFQWDLPNRDRTPYTGEPRHFTASLSYPLADDQSLPMKYGPAYQYDFTIWWLSDHWLITDIACSADQTCPSTPSPLARMQQ